MKTSTRLNVRGVVLGGVLAALFITNPASGAEADPVVALKELLKVVERDGTPTRVTDFSAKGQWDKRHYTAQEIKFDVRKTDSLVSPYVATVTWLDNAYLTPERGTKQEAEADSLPKEPTVKADSHSTPLYAKLAWQEGKWIVQDVGWDDEVLNMSKSHLKTSDYKDPVHDWWVTFGGADEFRAREAKAELAERERLPATETLEKGKKAALRTREKAASDNAEKAKQRAKDTNALKERKAPSRVAEWRTWTDSSGTHKIEAKFGGMVSNKVKLIKRDGTSVQVLLEKLSEDDQNWIKRGASK